MSLPPQLLSSFPANFQVFILNAAALSATTTSNITYTLSTSIAGLARRTNTLSRARLNVSAHYDISNAMFAAFLSSDMTYSCAIWQPKGSPLAAHESLETAQATKLNAIMRYARLRASDHVLEIGSGWGSFAIAAVRATGCRVTTLTLSAEQARLANERIRAAGLQDRIDVRLCDYRALPAPPTVRPYDKIVSIEMLENVGPGLLTTYFACVERLLAPRGGIAVFQCITIPEARYPVYAAGEDFIRRYIFPGGHLPTLTQLVAAVTEGGAGRLVVEGVRNIGGHYAKTLRIWREAFVREWDTIEKEVTARGMDAGVFRRKWEVSAMRFDMILAKTLTKDLELKDLRVPLLTSVCSTTLPTVKPDLRPKSSTIISLP